MNDNKIKNIRNKPIDDFNKTKSEKYNLSNSNEKVINTEINKNDNEEIKQIKDLNLLINDLQLKNSALAKESEYKELVDYYEAKINELQEKNLDNIHLFSNSINKYMKNNNFTNKDEVWRKLIKTYENKICDLEKKIIFFEGQERKMKTRQIFFEKFCYKAEKRIEEIYKECERKNKEIKQNKQFTNKVINENQTRKYNQTYNKKYNENYNKKYNTSYSQRKNENQNNKRNKQSKRNNQSQNNKNKIINKRNNQSLSKKNNQSHSKRNNESSNKKNEMNINYHTFGNYKKEYNDTFKQRSKTPKKETSKSLKNNIKKNMNIINLKKERSITPKKINNTNLLTKNNNQDLQNLNELNKNKEEWEKIKRMNNQNLYLINSNNENGKNLNDSIHTNYSVYDPKNIILLLNNIFEFIKTLLIQSEDEITLNSIFKIINDIKNYTIMLFDKIKLLNTNQCYIINLICDLNNNLTEFLNKNIQDKKDINLNKIMGQLKSLCIKLTNEFKP